MKAIRSWSLLAIAVCAVVLSASGMNQASAAPTIGGGDCWRSTTPEWCWYQHVDGQSDLYYNVDRFSAAGRPNWQSAFITALQNWNVANGPQSFSTAGRPGARPIYYEIAYDAQLGAGVLGLTTLCDTSGVCHSDNSAGYVVDHAYVRINVSAGEAPDNSGPLTVNVFAHESGHTVGNFHSSDSRDLMWPYANTTVLAPRDANDIGALPPCNGSLGSTNSNNNRAGTRCVSHWSS
jgi:hypothetical protein